MIKPEDQSPDWEGDEVDANQRRHDASNETDDGQQKSVTEPEVWNKQPEMVILAGCCSSYSSKES